MNHHHTPQFYLAKWKDPTDSKVNTYYYVTAEKLVCKKRGTKHIGCSEALYQLYNVEDEGKDMLETQHYKILDGKASNIMMKLVKEGVLSLNQVERELWCDFLFSMLIRNKEQIERTTLHSRHIMSEVDNSMSEEDKEKYAFEHSFFKVNIANMVIAALSGYNVFGPQEVLVEFKQALLSLRWWIDDYASLDLNLITCDRPVIIYPVSEENIYQYNGQIKTLLQECDYILSMPISPSQCFFAYKGKRPNKRLNQILKAQNFNIIANANNQIYTLGLNHDKFIRKYFKNSQLIF